MFIGVVFGILTVVVLGRLNVDLPPEAAVTLLLFVSWAFTGLLTVFVNWLVFRRATGEQLREWMTATSPKNAVSRFWYFVSGVGGASWATSGSGIAVIAVLAVLFTPGFRDELILVGAGIAVVIGSLVLTIAVYAVQYARESANHGGISFPNTENPRYVDFFYLSVQISTTSASSDVSLTSSTARRLVTTHSLISFTFNTMIVALLVSMLVTSATA